MTELLQRLGVAIGISLVLTLLLMVLYQDDSTMQPEATTITQAATTTASVSTAHGTP
jgi:hypothetical protein